MNGLETILHIFPTSIIDAMARGDVLQIVAFSLIFAMAVSLAGEAGKPVLLWCDSLRLVMFKFAGVIMKFAPVGVGAAIAVTVGAQGLGALLSLGKLLLTLYLALADFHRGDFRRGHRAAAHSAPAVHPRGAQSVHARLRHRQQRGRAARRLREDGTLRRAARHRRLRPADGLLVQPRRHHALSRRRLGLHRAGRADRRRATPSGSASSSP